MTEHIVDPKDGQSTQGQRNPGGKPYFRLNHVRTFLQPGDTVTIRPGTLPGDWFWPTTSGTEDQKITVKGADPHNPPSITGAGYNGAVINLGFAGRYHYTFQDLAFSDITCESVVNLNAGASHNEFRFCRFFRHRNGIVLNQSHKNLFSNLHMVQAGTTSGTGAGEHIFLRGSSDNLIIDSTFQGAGHYAIAIEHYLYSQNVSTQNRLSGNTIIQQDGGGGIALALDTTHTTVDNNRIFYAGGGVNYPKSGIQCNSSHNTIHHNLIIEPDNYGISLEAYDFHSKHQSCIGNEVSNNTIVDSKQFGIFVTQRHDEEVSTNHIYNNLITGSANYAMLFETYHAQAGNKWDTFPSDNSINGNLFYGQATLKYKEGVHDVQWLNNQPNCLENIYQDPKLDDKWVPGIPTEAGYYDTPPIHEDPDPPPVEEPPTTQVPLRGEPIIMEGETVGIKIYW